MNSESAFMLMKSVNPSEDAIAAKDDPELLNRFIEQNKHFILASAYKAAGHFVTESDDEYSIALIAFHEAIRSYDSSKGHFHAFAALVIKRRLYDYIRSESRFNDEITVEPSSMNGTLDEASEQMGIHLEVTKKEVELSEQRTQMQPGTTPIQDEIQAVQQILNGYGFSFFDLADCSPKAEKTKKACGQAVAWMLQHPELIRKMQKTGNLPSKEIKESADVSRKILERHRKYIIAAIEILNGEYPLLAEYMNYIRKELSP